MEYTYKIIPYMYWQTTELEKWLSDLALEGLEVVSIGKTWAKLKRIQPKRMLYKIIFNEESINKDSKVLDEWKEINTSTKYYLYVLEQKDPIIQLDYDINKEIQDIEKLLKGCKSEGIMICIILTVCAVLLICSVGEGIIYNLITYNSNTYILFSAIYLGQMIQAINEYRGIKGLERLKLNYKSDIKLTNKETYKKVHKINLIRMYTFWGMIALCLVLINGIDSEDKRYVPLSVEDLNIPIVRLASLESDKTFAREVSEDEDDVDWYNAYKEEKHLGICTQYVTRENAKVSNTSLKVDEPFINQTTYRLVFENMVKPFTKGLLKQNMRIQNKMKEVEEPRVDTLYIEERFNGIQVIAGKGNLVMDLYYQGNSSNQQVIEEVINILEAYQ